MRVRGLIPLLVLAFLLGANAHASAQTGYVEPFAGVLIVDDGELGDNVSVDPAAMFGGVLGFALAPGWEVAAAYAFAPATAEGTANGEVVETDVDIHAYFAAVNYILPTETTIKFLLTGGVGGLTISPDVEGVDSSNDLLVNFGAGARYMVNDRVAIQGAARDHVQFCSAADADDPTTFSACPLDDTTLHHIEISGGVLILF